MVIGIIFVVQFLTELPLQGIVLAHQDLSMCCCYMYVFVFSTSMYSLWLTCEFIDLHKRFVLTMLSQECLVVTFPQFLSALCGDLH